jgi:ribosomal RNA-processing protein 36
MSSTKRKAPVVELQRRVRARREASEELHSASSINEEAPSEEDSDDASTSKSENEVCIRLLKLKC